MEGYLAGLADGSVLQEYRGLKGQQALLGDVMKAIEQLPHRHVRHEAHGNPMLHFIREHTYVLPDQEWGGAVSTAELVAAWRLTHPSDPRPTRSLQMHLAAAVKTVYTHQLKDGANSASPEAGVGARSESLTFT